MSPLMDAAEAAYYAQLAANEAHGNLTRAQSAGVDPMPPGAEYLLAEAEYRWRQFAKLTGIGRPESKPAVEPTFPDWQSSVGAVDWSRSRGGAV
jgi:hypothetical protein